MANKKTKSESGGMGKWNGVVNIPINDGTVGDAINHYKKDGFFADLGDLVAADYKVSVSFDNRSSCYMVSISCYDSDDPNFKFTVVTRGPEVDVVVALALYKHFVLAECKWGGEATSQSTYS